MQFELVVAALTTFVSKLSILIPTYLILKDTKLNKITFEYWYIPLSKDDNLFHKLYLEMKLKIMQFTPWISKYLNNVKNKGFVGYENDNCVYSSQWSATKKTNKQPFENQANYNIRPFMSLN